MKQFVGRGLFHYPQIDISPQPVRGFVEDTELNSAAARCMKYVEMQRFVDFGGAAFYN